jgi:hypothetical protein
MCSHFLGPCALPPALLPPSDLSLSPCSQAGPSSGAPPPPSTTTGGTKYYRLCSMLPASLRAEVTAHIDAAGTVRNAPEVRALTITVLALLHLEGGKMDESEDRAGVCVYCMCACAGVEWKKGQERLCSASLLHFFLAFSAILPRSTPVEPPQVCCGTYCLIWAFRRMQSPTRCSGTPQTNSRGWWMEGEASMDWSWGRSLLVIYHTRPLRDRGPAET